jgi:hypothetical protein
MNNSIKNKNPSRSISKPKPLKNSSSTTKLKQVTKSNKGSTGKIKSKAPDKKIKKKSKSVEPICLTSNIEVINKLITNTQQIANEQDSLIERFSDITKKVTANDYEIDRLLNRTENDEFISILEKSTNSLSNILTRLKNHTEEAENIKCN